MVKKQSTSYIDNNSYKRTVDTLHNRNIFKINTTAGLLSAKTLIFSRHYSKNSSDHVFTVYKKSFVRIGSCSFSPEVWLPETIELFFNGAVFIIQSDFHLTFKKWTLPFILLSVSFILFAFLSSADRRFVGKSPLRILWNNNSGLWMTNH